MPECWDAGGYHAALLTSEGAAVADGDNAYGQCGLPGLVAGRASTFAAVGECHRILLTLAPAVGQTSLCR